MATPDIREVHEDRVEIGSDFLLERGPARVVATANAEVLSNEVSAVHYFLPRELKDAQGQTVLQRNGKPVMQHARDAYGRPIREGEEFTYLDWLAPKEEWPWYLARKGFLVCIVQSQGPAPWT